MNILTFDIEDWFHILDNPDTSGVAEWSNFESRLSPQIDLILSLLEKHNQKATFFWVSWLAAQHPQEVKKITRAGHEIGSHSHLHQLVYKQDPKAFAQDLHQSIDILEQISGTKVKCFRAPGFSITKDTPWAFEVLLNHGIEIDCSVFPARRAHGGFSNFGSAAPTWIACKGMRLKEFPINTVSFFGSRIIFSGGGYFRLFPYRMIRRFTENSDYVMTYFHPRDFDAKQPMVPGLSVFRKFKSYYGLKYTASKLEKWITDFDFMDLKSADETINWATQSTLSMEP